jgi:hypothetical protein
MLTSMHKEKLTLFFPKYSRFSRPFYHPTLISTRCYQSSICLLFKAASEASLCAVQG